MNNYQTYKTKEGKEVNAYYITDERFKKMEENGYLWKSSNFTESAQECYDRLSKEYSIVKIYSHGTRVKGIRHLYAMVKY